MPHMSNPEEILESLLTSPPGRTKDAPRDARGIYGLVDHRGDLRYIGSTSSASETLHKRIHYRHRTGSETMSHYFSHMYNTGRMWRLRNDAATKADGEIAKALRNAFIAEYCRAVWVPLPDDFDIPGLERAVLEIAPKEHIAWNRRRMEVYEEPRDLVDAMITSLGLSDAEVEAVTRQEARFFAHREIQSGSALPAFPSGPFEFFALDVETANNDRASICQIGIAGVRPDHSIETWVTYVDPRTDAWSCTWVHGIDRKTVRGAPVFSEVLPLLEEVLEGRVIYQHSGFDRSALIAASKAAGLELPAWEWRDSVQVARKAWPELKGNGGHGLASLKDYLGLDFKHHDAAEDARASAEIVLMAAGNVDRPKRPAPAREDFDVIDLEDEPVDGPPPLGNGPRLIGETELTAGNLANNHIYLRAFLGAFPGDAIGGSNKSSLAPRMVTIDWGAASPATTDIDGSKKFFRNRAWVRDFFERTNARSGDIVVIHEVAPYRYAVSLKRKL